MKNWPALLVLALAGCVASPDSRRPYKTTVDGWVEKGDLHVAVADERPLTPRSRTYDEGPLGLPAPFGLSPERVVDEYVALDEKYKITDTLLPEPLAGEVKKRLPPPPNKLPVGTERRPRPALVRVAAAGEVHEVETDETGHARLPLARIAIAALERGEATERVTLSVAEGGESTVTLSRNDLIDLADEAPRLPDYGHYQPARGYIFWAVVAARAKDPLLRREAEKRSPLRLDARDARRLVETRWI